MWSYSCYISQFEKWRQQEIENLFNNAKEGDTQILHSNHGLQSDLCVLNWVFKTSLTVPVDFQREFLKSNSIVAVQERETAVLSYDIVQLVELHLKCATPCMAGTLFSYNLWKSVNYHCIIFQNLNVFSTISTIFNFSILSFKNQFNIPWESTMVEQLIFNRKKVLS